MPAQARQDLEQALGDVQATLKTDDGAGMETKAQRLEQALSAAMASPGPQEPPTQAAGEGGEDVVDAEFREVKDDPGK